MNYVRNHFESLYQIENNSTKVDAGKSFIDDGNGNVLDEEDKILLNRNISSGEILNALKTSNNKSAPGSDGLPGEVYKIFWNEIQGPLLDCFNYSFDKRFLCNSQTSAIICLHHKGKRLS